MLAPAQPGHGGVGWEMWEGRGDGEHHLMISVHFSGLCLSSERVSHLHGVLVVDVRALRGACPGESVRVVRVLPGALHELNDLLLGEPAGCN